MIGYNTKTRRNFDKRLRDTVFYDTNLRFITTHKKRKFEKKCTILNIYQKNLSGHSVISRVRNEEVRRRAGTEIELASRADQRVLRWFGHVERMDEYCMARRVLIAEVRVGGTRKTEVRLDGWCEGGLSRNNARKIGKSGEPWYICN